MELKLTNKQLTIVKNRLKQNSIEEIQLRTKQKEGKYVDGWDFADLQREKGDLEYIIEKGCIEI
jgi:hypothetical protein